MWGFIAVLASIIQQTIASEEQRGPSIAMFCGKNSMYRDLTSGDWRPDPSGTANCTQDKAELFLYCKKMYPTLNITNIVSENSKVAVGPWCSLNHKTKPCKGHKHQVTPIKCLVGTYESPALKVASSCKFHHKHDSAVCNTHDYWADQALNDCHQQEMRLEDNYSMLQSCDEPDQWHGVEYVCCPQNDVPAKKVVQKYGEDPLRDIMPILQGVGPVIIDQQQQPKASAVCSLPMLVGRCKAAFPRWYYDITSQSCSQFVFGGCGGNGNNFESRDECEESCLVRTNSVKRDSTPVVEIKRDDVTIDDVSSDDVCSQPKFTGPCRAMFHKYYYNTATSNCELFVYGGCGANGNNFESQQECIDRCSDVAPTTTTPPPSTTTVEVEIIDIDPDIENQQYLKARMEEDTWYSNQVSQVIADWGVENADILKNWRLEMEQKIQKEKLQKEFNRKIQQLKETHDSNLERITSEHQQKMESFIEKQRSKSYETFKQQISVETPDSDMVLQSLELYLSSEKQGQDHTVSTFQLAFDNGEISDEDAQLLRGDLQQKLDQIQSRAMETIALLNQHPQMKMEIQETIDQMLDSILPVHTLQLPTDDDDDDSRDTIDEGGLVDPQPPQPQSSIQQQPVNMAAAWDGITDYDSTEGGTLLKSVSIMSGCVALVVILAALARYYQANKLHHSQFTKIQVDDHLTVEEKQLLQMQQNGYENPTYKFFEKQQHPQA